MLANHLAGSRQLRTTLASGYARTRSSAKKQQGMSMIHCALGQKMFSFEANEERYHVKVFCEFVELNLAVNLPVPR